MKNITILFTILFFLTINNVYAYPGRSLQGLCDTRTYHESRRIKAINVSTENNAYAMNILIDNDWYYLNLKEGYSNVIPRAEMFKLAQFAFDRNLFVNVCTGTDYITGIEITSP
ncbi:hypothetical protein [Vibrio sp. NH-UV-68]|uniref:hypothetical protein n=1 Tax=unclassified Vibrio TaxID=2614977 RepID=UPI0036F2BB43